MKMHNKALLRTSHKVRRPENADVGSENNGNCTANGPSPTINGKSIDHAETIWESEARNSQ